MPKDNIFPVTSKVRVDSAADKEDLEPGLVARVGLTGSCFFLGIRARRPGLSDIAFSSRITSETLTSRLSPSRPMNPVPPQREQLGFTPRQVQSGIILITLHWSAKKRQCHEKGFYFSLQTEEYCALLLKDCRCRLRA